MLLILPKTRIVADGGTATPLSWKKSVSGCARAPDQGKYAPRVILMAYGALMQVPPAGG